MTARKFVRILRASCVAYLTGCLSWFYNLTGFGGVTSILFNACFFMYLLDYFTIIYFRKAYGVSPQFFRLLHALHVAFYQLVTILSVSYHLLLRKRRSVVTPKNCFNLSLLVVFNLV